MKRNLLLLGCIIGAALWGNNASAQVNYSEGFEGTINWGGTGFINSTDSPCEGTHSYLSDLHGGFVPNGSDTAISPSLGSSNGSQVSLAYNYKVLNSQNGQPVLNSSNWGSITVAWGTSATGPWTTLETINPSNHVESADCAERTLTFTPANGSQVYIRFFTELITFSNFIHIHIDDITATQQTFAMDWVNLQSPATMTLDFGETGTVYAQGFEAGLTEAAGAGAGITAWIGVNAANTDPATWTTWIPATFNVQSGNNDEYMASIGTGLQGGTYYYASRFQLNGGTYSYGGTNGIWNGTTNISGVLTVNCDTPAPVADATQIMCEGSTLADLEVAGDEIIWYTAATGGFLLPESTVLTEGGVYFAAQIPTAGCESAARTQITVDLTVIAAPVITQTTQTFCNSADVEELEPQENIVWYSSSMGGTPLDGTTHLEDGIIYYAAQIVDDCESMARTGVTVEINTTPAPTGDPTQTFTFHPTESVTIADIVVNATGTVTWYATEENAEDGVDPLSLTDVIPAGTATYYATQTIDGCEGSPFAVTVDAVLGNEDFAQGIFTYYPNPVKDIFTISYTDSISSIEVYNLLGQKVFSKQVNANEAQVDIAQLSSGTYLVKAAFADGVKIIKIVKQ